MNASSDDERATPRSPAAEGCEIVVARYAGYCYGVERALRLTEEALARVPGPVATLGPIIHNPSVVRGLAARGVGVVDEVGEMSEGTLVVRTHGVPPEVVAAAHARGLEVVDATCPFVAVAQRKAHDLHEGGYTVVILGEHDHPEVAGLQGFAGGEAIVVAGPADVPVERLRGRRVGVVVQTTQARETLARLAAALAPLARELVVFNTVCEATEKRQSAACELAAQVDVVIVVGGRNSANTMRLVQLCRDIQPRTHHIESAGELREAWVTGARRVGVTAGASTPDSEIEETVDRLRTTCEASDGR
ncbi:MAG TPA: 4-hydroxy-3-methylbut-2-enyl diphosphate reductase [Thermoleophilia bacterium]|nr:4-hydroxy-3-methylbut-2-enyl diphosphate reductase [Thermoleophilia bacterium]HQG03529.1 4-hydroxy-3-methylbut-2-enyl diphosphate reductase [Thermoleophilia bacterium]